MKKECIAMLLAGGQGSRLYVLTGAMAKPAVPFGGKFRIIDFPLSNCTNSGIDTVGVLTQYRPMELNSYIGSGQPWDLDSSSGGVHILPPLSLIHISQRQPDGRLAALRCASCHRGRRPRLVVQRLGASCKGCFRGRRF